jgi:hypothetical protein
MVTIWKDENVVINIINMKINKYKNAKKDDGILVVEICFVPTHIQMNSSVWTTMNLRYTDGGTYRGPNVPFGKSKFCIVCQKKSNA